MSRYNVGGRWRVGDFARWSRRPEQIYILERRRVIC